MKIGLIVGSLRTESWNRKVAQAALAMFPEDVEAEFIEIRDLPLYNQDFEGEDAPESYGKFRESVRQCDGFIFFTPEYNRSYAPAIKNALDVGSRDPEGNPWENKRAAVFSASMGGFGGMAANHALRQVFICLDIIPVQQPEVYLAKIHTAFDGGSVDERTGGLLKKGVLALVDSLR